MSDEFCIKIFGKNINTREEMISIETLVYNKNNPRVYSILYGDNSQINSHNNTQEEIQEEIYKIMLEQPSVKNIKQDIYDNGGLLEPILIRHDTMEVIEGNSRLTAYKFWNVKDTDNEIWQKIPCRIVSKLTEKQQDAYLNSIHIKGKTPWTAYEKANLIYKRFNENVSIDDIAKRFSETENEIKKRINTIGMMVENTDNKQENFSYYDVIERTANIKEKIQSDSDLKESLFQGIKNDSNYFNAIDLRKKLPVILKNKKHTKKFIKNKNLNEVYEAAKTNNPDKKLRLAITKMQDITKNEISRLEASDINKLKLTLKNLKKEYKRIEGMIKQCEQ